MRTNPCSQIHWILFHGQSVQVYWLRWKWLKQEVGSDKPTVEWTVDEMLQFPIFSSSSHLFFSLGLHLLWMFKEKELVLAMNNDNDWHLYNLFHPDSPEALTCCTKIILPIAETWPSPEYKVAAFKECCRVQNAAKTLAPFGRGWVVPFEWVNWESF